MKGLPGSPTVRAAATALAALTCACAPPEPTIADRILGSDLRLLPKESVGLAVVEMQALRDREAAERWLDDLVSGIGDFPSVAIVRQAVGEEAVRKVDRLALALVPQAGGSTGYAVLAEGSFEESRMRDLTGGQGILTLVAVSGRPDVSLTVLPGGNPVFGPREILERVHETRAGRSAGLNDSRLLGILRRVRSTAQIWGAVDYAPLSDLARRALNTREGDAPIPPAGSGHLRALSFQGMIDKTITFDLFGEADAEPGARQLADAARGLVALARMSASQQEALLWLEFLDSIRIDQRGQEVQVHGALTGAMARALVGHLPRAGEGAALPGRASPEAGRLLPPESRPTPPEGSRPAGGSRPPA